MRLKCWAYAETQDARDKKQEFLSLRFWDLKTLREKIQEARIFEFEISRLLDWKALRQKIQEARLNKPESSRLTSEIQKPTSESSRLKAEIRKLTAHGSKLKTYHPNQL